MFYCFWGGYKSQWSIIRGFNWKHSNSRITHKLTDLFCLTILFAKFNFSKFYSELPCKYWGVYPNKISQWSKSIVFNSIKYGGRLFMADVGQLFLANLLDCSTWRANDWINCQSWRDIHLKIKPWPINRIVEVFIPEVNC